MAETDRRAHQLKALDGRPLAAVTFKVYSMLQTFVRSDVARADREGGPPPEVRFTKEQLSGDGPRGVGCSVRSLERHLADLQKAYWIKKLDQVGPWWVVCIYNPDRRQLILDSLDGSTENSTGSSGSKITKGHDPPRQDCRRSPTKLADTSPKLSEISDSSDDPRIVNSLKLIPELSPRFLEAFTHAARERLKEAGPVTLALEIVQKTIPPRPPAVPIPATRSGTRHLAALLAEGHDVGDLLGLLCDAPAIIDAGLREPDRYGPQMFLGDILTRWRRARMTLQSQRLLAEQTPRSSAVVAETRAPTDADLGSLANLAKGFV